MCSLQCCRNECEGATQTDVLMIPSVSNCNPVEISGASTVGDRILLLSAVIATECIFCLLMYHEIRGPVTKLECCHVNMILSPE